MHCVKLGLPLVRNLSCCVVFPNSATRCVFARCSNREVSSRCCLGPVLIALGPRDVGEPLSMACHGKFCLPLVADWSSNSIFQLLGVSDLRLSVRSLFFFSGNSTREHRHVGIVQAFVIVILNHGLENINGACCVLCLCRQTPLAQSTEFSAAPVNNDRSAIEGWRRCQLAATRVGVSRTLFLHLGSPHSAVLLLGTSGLAR